MNRTEQKKIRRLRRKMRVRKTVFGTTERPRLTVFRSLQHIYAQLIDDVAGRTLLSASTKAKDLRAAVGYGGNKKAAAAIGKTLGERAVAQGIKQAVLDRNGYRYHGRVEALAKAAREAGLKI
ncbi:MAG TPA: 50S ribosomal protein L18 [Phycisphaerae bacterium]|nr:50S ribosomal protein L18 [Phycisphaerae bacterium]HRY67833.1 50S ribosomal protein L18 [Phycisphaerae bacterium]HSA25286.1 50S ribosomal protein L18 [Phycisphaerae bacterium]